MPENDDDLLALAERWEQVSRAEEGCARSLRRLEEAGDDFASLSQAEKDYAVAEQECGDLRRQIALRPARTLEGILFKTAVARWCYSTDLDGIADLLRMKMEIETPYGPTAATVCESVVLDLMRFERSARKEAKLIQPT